MIGNLSSVELFESVLKKISSDFKESSQIKISQVSSWLQENDSDVYRYLLEEFINGEYSPSKLLNVLYDERTSDTRLTWGDVDRLMDKIEYGVVLDGPLQEFNEMATVARNITDNYVIVVTPDTGYNNSYIKVCNNQSYVSATHVIRLAFTEAKYYQHKGDGKKLWKMSKRVLKKLVEFLQSKPNSDKINANTNWDLAIYLWNNECGFTSHKDYDESLPKGCKDDSELFKEPQFVPLNTPIPKYETIKIK